MVKARNRTFDGERSIWDANAWDNVPWTPEDAADAEARIDAQAAGAPLLADPDAVARVVSGPAARRWDEFYGRHDRWFFKDRRWLADEFPGLVAAETVLEVGCGVGNTVFPLMRARRCARGLCVLPDHFVDGAHVGETAALASSGQLRDPDAALDAAAEDFQYGSSVNSGPIDGDRSNHADPDALLGQEMGHVYACDFSANAVALLKQHREFDAAHTTAFVHDITSDAEPDVLRFLHGRVDALLAVFVLSALDPAALPGVFGRLGRLLRPGTGRLLLRDYAAHDMTQLRFRPERMVRRGLYVRGDGTAVHYFGEDEVRGLAAGAGLRVARMALDRRVIVNRSRRITMRRCWLQAELVREEDGR